jgi:hypothetical protein
MNQALHSAPERYGKTRGGGLGDGPAPQQQRPPTKKKKIKETTKRREAHNCVLE